MDTMNDTALTDWIFATLTDGSRTESTAAVYKADAADGAASIADSAPLVPLIRNVKIMVIDDEPAVVDVIQSYLRKDGQENTVGVTDSKLALETIKTEFPDIVILDIQMPQVSGIEILKAIRSDDRLGPIPIVVLTADTEDETRHKVFQLGATDVLYKPVDYDQLLSQMHHALIVRSHQHNSGIAPTRRSPRYMVPENVHIKVTATSVHGTAEPSSGKLCDFSLNGAKVALDKQLPLNERFNLSINSADMDLQISAQAEAGWSLNSGESIWQHGFMFVEMLPDSVLEQLSASGKLEVEPQQHVQTQDKILAHLRENSGADNATSECVLIEKVSTNGIQIFSPVRLPMNSMVALDVFPENAAPLTISVQTQWQNPVNDGFSVSCRFKSERCSRQLQELMESKEE